MSNIPEYSVSEISSNIKHSLENQFNRVKIKGEISGLTRANSGHFYFNLKDEEANLASVISYFPDIQFIIAPHEVSIQRLSKIKNQFGENCALLSACNLSLIHI